MQTLSKQEVAALTKPNDVLAGLLLGLRVLFHGVCVVLALRAFEAGRIWLGLLWAIPHLAAYSFLGWAGIGHELFHHSVFSSRSLNRFLFKLFSVLTWNNYFYFAVSHPIHHRLTLASNDPEGVRPARMDWLTFLQLLTIDVASFQRRLPILVQNALGKAPETGLAGVLFPPGSPARARLCTAARVVLAVQGGLLALFIVSQTYWLILLVTLAPFCLTFLNRTLAAGQHFGLEGAGRDYTRSCRTVVLDPVLAFFYANMNYHVEHHYFPAVPYYRLPRAHRLLKARAEIPNLTEGYPAMLRQLSRNGFFPKVA